MKKQICKLSAMLLFSLHATASHAVDQCLTKNSKIAIVGGGVSGLTAAKTLQRKGYTNVTVFEKDSQVGGKVKTFNHEGLAVDTGAIIVAEDFKEIFSEAKSLKVPMETFTAGPMVKDQGNYLTLNQFIDENYNTFELAVAMVRFKALLLEYPIIKEDNLSNIPPSLAIPMADYLKKHNAIVPLAEAARPFITAWGYSFYENVPAIYILKFLYFYYKESIRTATGEIFNTGYEPKYYYFKNGYQSLWVEFAKSLNVKLNHEVSKVVRKKRGACDEIHLTANNQTQIFDKIIISSPFAATKKFLDQTNQESQLGSMVKTVKYATVVYEADFTPANESLYFRDYQYPHTSGEVMANFNHKTRDLHSAYLFLPADAGQEFVEMKIKKMLASEGGQLHKILKIATWDYFPHVDSKNIIGFYRDMEALQGKNGTYYNNSAMNFETVFQSYRYSKALIERFF